MVDRKLGRGLDFFLSPSSRGVKPAESVEGAASPAGVQLHQVELDRLVPNPRQPRTTIDQGDLSELTDSIRVSGILQPILARQVGDRLEIVAGERRWRAAKLAGLSTVPVVVRPTRDDESGVLALIENLQREDLNALEKAHAFRELQRTLEVGQEEVARRVGLDRSTVANFVRLLELSPEVQAHVSRGTLTMGHARALLAVKDKQAQVRIADSVVRRSLSVRALEELIREQVGSSPSSSSKKQKAGPNKAAWVKEIEDTLCEALGTPVTVRYGRKSSVIQVHCAGREQFERLYERLKNC